MSLLNGVFEVVHRVFPARVVHAHCDIPCGIYDPHAAQLAALTIIRMNQLIDGLTRPGPDAPAGEQDAYVAAMERYVSVKEQHAELCKQELRILWGDYFKPEHLKIAPDLHDRFWDGMRLASAARQKNDMEVAQSLLSTVHGIAEIFWKTKGAGSTRQSSRQTVGGELVYPA